MPPPEPGSALASRRSSPRPQPPDGTGTASAWTPGFAPCSHPQSTPRRRQALTHWPGYYTYGINRTSKRCLPLHSCTLMSHVIRRGLDGDLLDPQLHQLTGQVADRAGGGLHVPHLADSPVLTRGPHAHHSGCLGHVDGAYPFHHQLVIGVGNLFGHRSVLWFRSQFACPPIHTEHGAGRLGASVKGTESLTGVLEATVRDPSRSGPRRQAHVRA